VQGSVCHCEKEASCIGDGASEPDSCIGSGEMEDGCRAQRVSVTVK